MHHCIAFPLLRPCQLIGILFVTFGSFPLVQNIQNLKKKKNSHRFERQFRTQIHADNVMDADRYRTQGSARRRGSQWSERVLRLIRIPLHPLRSLSPLKFFKHWHTHTHTHFARHRCVCAGTMLEVSRHLATPISHMIAGCPKGWLPPEYCSHVTSGLQRLTCPHCCSTCNRTEFLHLTNKSATFLFLILLIRCLWQQKGGTVDISMRHHFSTVRTWSVLLKTMPKHFHRDEAKETREATSCLETSILPHEEEELFAGQVNDVKTQTERLIWPTGRLLPSTNETTAFSSVPSSQSDHLYTWNGFPPNLTSWPQP